MEIGQGSIWTLDRIRPEATVLLALGQWNQDQEKPGGLLFLNWLTTVVPHCLVSLWNNLTINQSINQSIEQMNMIHLSLLYRVSKLHDKWDNSSLSTCSPHFYSGLIKYILQVQLKCGATSSWNLVYFLPRIQALLALYLNCPSIILTSSSQNDWDWDWANKTHEMPDFIEISAHHVEYTHE